VLNQHLDKNFAPCFKFKVEVHSIEYKYKQLVASKLRYAT
jgi:hypothetical protein